MSFGFKQNDSSAVVSKERKGDAMSLFEDDGYQYRDTFFVLFKDSNRPNTNQIRNSLEELGGRYEIININENESGFDSVTVKSPYDFSAMDIVYVSGDEVRGQVAELMEEFRNITLMGDEAAKLKRLKECNARFDVYHFEQSGATAGGGEEEFLDPGGLLLVMEKLTEISNGIGIDPQSMSLF